MRTKKILSTLLAAAMLLGIGVPAAFAAGTEDPSFEPQAVAQTSWPSSVTIERDGNNSGWDYATVVWKGFTAEKDSAGKTIVDSYYDQRLDGVTSIDWRVTIKLNGKDYEPKIESNPATAATKSYAFYTKYDGTNEMLCLYQGTTPYYGEVKVEVYITAENASGIVVDHTGSPPPKDPADREYIALKNPIKLTDKTDFNDLLEEASKLLAKKDRFDKDYYTLLQGVYGGVAGYRDAPPLNFQEVEDAVKSLKEVMADAENHYKLIGWDFLDKLIAKPYYKIVDFFDTYSGAIDAVKNAFTVIGSAFGFLVPIFQIIFGLFI